MFTLTVITDDFTQACQGEEQHAIFGFHIVLKVKVIDTYFIGVGTSTRRRIVPISRVPTA
jgi:hypothetical protein